MTDIATLTRSDLDEVLPLVRAYLDFYEVSPPDDAVRALCEALIDDPREGLQLVARDEGGRAVAFATIYWTWSTLSASRIGIMNDLFVAPEARGSGVADALIAACADRCREHGATVLEWSTALDNHRAQAVYDRIGGRSSRWLSYELPVTSPRG
jgi:GNAT superfamily N-acetyltransferase